MNLRGTEILCGGPIKEMFTAGRFDGGMRGLVLDTVAALEAVGAAVHSAHIAEDFAPVALTSQDVTVRDHAWCDSCDVYVALLPTDSDGAVFPSAGTAIELGWVSGRHKPVVIAWEERHAGAYSHLVRGLGSITPTVFVDLAEMRHDPGVLTAAVEQVGRLGSATRERDGGGGHAHRRPR